MAKLRVAPEALATRMLPGCDAQIVAVGFDRYGTVIFEIEGPGVPDTAGEVTATIYTMTGDGPRIIERLELSARERQK